ncbi:MAG: helix-turn-helix domain-containing protein [Clostridia bacterium]|nr:helix-turn-helix domain-containing protein [Clostridia bacterium]
MHTHTHAELYVFLSGKGIYHIEGSEYSLEPGDILLMRPGESHYIEIDPCESYERIVVWFNTDLFSVLDRENVLMLPLSRRKAGTLNMYRRSDFQNQGYLDCILSMVSGDADPIKIFVNLINILQQIGTAFKEKLGTDDSHETPEQKIIAYINENLDQKLDLQSICERFYISRAQLCRVFRRATGTTVGKYITVKRLYACRQSILNGEPIGKVCQMYGYREYSTFYRAYLRQFGHSPIHDSQSVKKQK